MSSSKSIDRYLNIHSLTLGFVQVYLIETPDGLFLVDCGMPGQEKKILAAMQRLGRQDLKLIFITHAHADHTGSAAALKRLTGAQTAIHRLDAEALRTARMPARGRSWLMRQVMAVMTRLVRLQPVQPDIVLEDGDRLERYGLPGRAIHTPGHSPGSCCLVLDDHSGFVGDLVSTTGEPHLQHDIIDDWAQLHASYLRLRELELEKVYVGHGQRSLSGCELVDLIDAELDTIKGHQP
jgi:glyoxylase-like metal-dependent hydrolase (beta-lactamase superfamily II)